MVRCRRSREFALAAGRTGGPFDPLSCWRFCSGEPGLSQRRAWDESMKPGPIAILFGRLAGSVADASALLRLAGIGAVLVALTLVTPFAFETAGDNAFIALTVSAGLLTIMATRVAERAPADRALWL